MIGAPEAPSSDYVDSIADSRLWKRFDPRAGDIVIVTPPKSGTTWMQAIVAMLISANPEVRANISDNSPWVDALRDRFDAVMARLAVVTDRRHLKTHTPLDGIPFWADLQYVCVYRHPVDVYFSWRKHHSNMLADFNDMPAFDDPREGFRDYLERSFQGTAAPTLGSVIHHYKSAMEQRHRPNVLLVHYADLSRNLAGEMARVARFLGVILPPDVMEPLVAAAGFAKMKARADRFAPNAGKGTWKSDEAFFDSATSRKWTGILAEDDLVAYRKLASEALAPEALAWLEWESARPVMAKVRPFRRARGAGSRPRTRGRGGFAGTGPCDNRDVVFDRHVVSAGLWPEAGHRRGMHECSCRQ